MKIYQSIKRCIPIRMKRFIWTKMHKKENVELKRKILDYYKGTEDSELLEVVNYLEKNPLKFFCYEFADNAYKKKIAVHYDRGCRMHYMIINGRKMYFKRSMNADEARNYMRSIFCEQHEKSPHSYRMEEISAMGRHLNIIDLGGAEGYFAFCNIDNAEKIYVVECDSEWVEALEKTFAPWKDKVTIISRFVGSGTSADEIKCSSLLNPEMKNIIKMDIEGMEVPVLKELAESLELRECSGTRLIVCTYHNAGDEEAVYKILKNRDVEIYANPGYVFFLWQPDNKFEPPYFRRGVVFIDMK